MTLTITLAPEEETRLRHRAEQQGQPTEAVAAALLKQVLQADTPPAEAPPGGMTDAEFDAYWGPYIGVIHGSHEPLSENCGERFTEYLVEKKQQGHL